MRRTLLLFFICVFLVVGCIPSVALTQAVPQQSLTTPTPTFTQIPSLTSTLTPTVVPDFTPTIAIIPLTPLASHEWKPAPILITYSQDWFGFCVDVCPPPDPPPFILYGDGTLIIHGPYNPANGQWQYLYKKLNQSGICQILNTVDQTGFFDFDPTTYSISGVSDAGNWRVEVNAWRNKDVSLYGLGDEVDFLNNDSNLSPSETINPKSIRDTFTLLYNFPLTGMDVYIPKLLGIWIWKSSSKLPYSKEWTDDDISLAKLLKKAGSLTDALPHAIYLDGKDAEAIYAMFGNSNYHGEVSQNGVNYRVYIRSILPFEKISGDKSVILPVTNQMKLTSPLHCSPSDGIMPIPLYGPK